MLGIKRFLHLLRVFQKLSTEKPVTTMFDKDVQQLSRINHIKICRQVLGLVIRTDEPGFDPMADFCEATTDAYSDDSDFEDEEKRDLEGN